MVSGRRVVCLGLLRVKPWLMIRGHPGTWELLELRLAPEIV